MLFIFFPIISSAETTVEDVGIEVKIDGIDISNGEKGVNYGVNQINITWEDTDYIFNDERSLSEITINAKNSENEDKEESYKFSFTKSSSSIDLDIKTYQDSNENEENYQLQKHTLYSVYIPEGLLISSDGAKINKDIYFDFVTKGDNGNDILISVSPDDAEERVDASDNSIVYDFVDDITLNPLFVSSSDYINVTSETLGTDSSGYESDSAENFEISVEGNKLTLKKKDDTGLKDFSKYTIELKNQMLYLKDTASDVKIYNQLTSFEFKTNRTVESTNPEDSEEDVSLEPTIKIKFRYKPIDITNLLSHISLNIGGLDGEEVTLDDSNTEISMGSDGKTLIIELKDTESNVNGLLRANTSYVFSIEEGSIEFNIIDKDEGNLVNEEIVLNFTTGSSGESPNIIAFSSSPSLTDDITDLVSTNLDSSGSIYIAFDTAIEFDKDFEADVENDKEAINEYFRLREATTTVTDYVYSQQYNSDIHIYDIDEDISNLNSLIIEDAEILEYKGEYRVLKITPKYPLDNLSKYKLRIDKEAIENLSGYNMNDDIEFRLWTKKSSEDLELSWESVEGYKVDEFQEDTPYFELPKFGESISSYNGSDIVEDIGQRPIAIDVKGELIPKAQEDLFESLKSISLIDYYTDGEEGIDKIVTEAFLEDGETHTKLYIYPSQSLDYGRRYKLEIPSGAFQSRSGNDLAELEFNFVVKSDSNEEMNILCLENNENDIETISKEAWEILIRGYNFRQGIDKAVIKEIDGDRSVEIASRNIEFEDVTTIKVKIRDNEKSEILSKFGSIDSELALSITIYFEDGNSIEAEGFTITPKGSPDSVENDPSDMDIWYDENEINKKKIDGEYIYFLKVTFDDTDIDGDGVGELDIKHTESSDGTKNYTGLETLIENSSIKASGSSVSLLNSNFIRKVINIMEDENASESEKSSYLKYIFEKDEDEMQAYLYVPIKLLNSQITYNVTIASDVVVYSDSSEGNETITWSFTTMANPVVTDIFIGSVGEDYDEDEPIIITGEYFYDDVEVYFNDIKAEKVEIKEDEDGNTYLSVYLPDGGDRLEPGTYDIYIQNDENHVRELYGSFSVVEEGEWVPNEEYISNETDLGDVRADIKVSENTVMLKSKYADDKYLDLDLDELMGTKVLVRKIVIEGDKNDRIGILKTKSQWADIDLYNVRLDSNSDDDEITLILGRADQALKQALQKKLAGSSVKSEFIRVTAKNCVLDSIVLSIPFEKSNGRNLKVLRYDEDTRNFYMEKISVNQVDKIVTVQSKNNGIFVVIED